MPEHVHLLVSEPKNVILAKAIQALKLSISVKQGRTRLWQKRYYDFNVCTEDKRVEKAALHPSQSGDQRTRCPAGGLEVVELPSMEDRRIWHRNYRNRPHDSSKHSHIRSPRLRSETWGTRTLHPAFERNTSLLDLCPRQVARIYLKAIILESRGSARCPTHAKKSHELDTRG
jgi:hypothetical protein